MSLYASDGSFNVTVVDGTAITGLYAADGSYNVVQVDGTDYTGIMAPCGAFNVFVYTSGQPASRAPCGAFMISEDPYVSGTMKVTVVSGALT